MRERNCHCLIRSYWGRSVSHWTSHLDHALQNINVFCYCRCLVIFFSNSSGPIYVPGTVLSPGDIKEKEMPSLTSRISRPRRRVKLHRVISNTNQQVWGGRERGGAEGRMGILPEGWGEPQREGHVEAGPCKRSKICIDDGSQAERTSGRLGQWPLCSHVVQLRLSL